MTYVLRGESGWLRRLQSFSVSCALHALVIAWLASLHSYAEDKKSLYDMQIRPEERRIVWYKPAEKLPDVSPTPDTAETHPQRVTKKFDQTIIANARTNSKTEQMIFAPAPEIRMPDPLPLPNVVALAPPPRPVKQFTPPPDRVKPRPEIKALPDAPDVQRKLDNAKVDLAAVRPQPKQFQAPDVKKPQSAATPLPDAPQVRSSTETPKLAFGDVRPQPKAFQAPPDPAKPQGAASALPDAPQVTASVATPKLAFGEVRPQPKSFQTPDAKKPQGATNALPDAPEVHGQAQTASVQLAPVRPQPKAFQAPAGPSGNAAAPVNLPDAPTVAGTQRVDTNVKMADVRAPLKNFQAPENRLARQSPSDTPAAPLPAAPDANPAAPNLAIAGLHPVLKPDFAPPPGSRAANFSAGPNPDPTGAPASIPSPTSSSGALVVPGLLVRGGEKGEPRPLIALNSSPTARENLAAAMRSAPKAPPETGDQAPATRVTSAPDRRMEGRAIYTMAIQMPNISSYSGSWLVWYAEHEARDGANASEMRAPKPVRKVDPKYSPAAIDARIEGEVRLFAVIRKDGHVASVAVVRGVDDRLDRSAAEALSKWEFEPAMYAGAPIDIDAVFEIPFHVAPPPPHRGR